MSMREEPTIALVPAETVSSIPNMITSTQPPLVINSTPLKPSFKPHLSFTKMTPLQKNRTQIMKGIPKYDHAMKQVDFQRD